MKIKFKKLSESCRSPEKAYDTDACFDLFACLECDILLGKGESGVFPCGFALEMEPGWEAQVRPRSGNALKFGITVLNSPGTIDSSYRGMVQVILINLGKEDFIVKNGAKIAQMKFSKVYDIDIEEVDNINTTDRNINGFGSTGL